MKTLVSILFSLGMATVVMAQPAIRTDVTGDLPGKRAESNVRNAQYPRLLPDNRAIFRVKAPEAQKVQIDLGRKYDMTREADGTWTCTTDPLSEGFHYYFLIVDGVKVADPASESFYGCSMMSSGIEVPYPDGKNVFELADVPHGDIRMNRYFSKTDGCWKRMFVYTPYGYEQGNRKYPVLYLLHGGGEDERGWATQGRTDVILDNLIADGKAEPMIIVMAGGNTADIESELLKECIPFVESRYRVAEGKENRALAGLSMGGIQTLNVGIAHPELFAYLGVFSSGWWANPPRGFQSGNEAEKYYEMLKADKEGYNSGLKEFWISMGGKEDIAYNNCRIMRERLDEIGIKYTYFETPGGHTWPVWRESLAKFAPLLFKK